MMRASLVSLILAAVSGQASAQAITTMEVFANSATLVRQPQQPPPFVVKVYRLDGMAQLEAQLSAGLPQTEAAAMAYMRQHEAEIRRRYKEQISNAATGMTLSIQYRLDRLPAVVINKSKVIYGIADVDQAAQLYAQSLQSRQSQQRPTR